MSSSDTPPTAIGTASSTGLSAPVSAGSGTADLLVGHDFVRLVLSGDISAEMAAELSETFEEAVTSGLPVEIDAHHITFLDSAGVALLAQLAARLPQRPKVLRAPETVQFLLEITGVNQLLDVVA